MSSGSGESATGESTLPGAGERTLPGTGESTLPGAGESTLPGAGESTLPRALALAYRELSRRERSVAELRGYLLRRLDDDAEVVEAALRELRELGYLDDRRYAQMFVEDKTSLSEWGSERIRRDLQRRGVERQVIEDALAALAADDEQGSEAIRALGFLRRRLPESSGERRERERALAMLLRRGYEPEVAFAAVAEWSREAKEPAEGFSD